MPFDLATIITSVPSVVGAIGGTVGVISGIAVFARRRIRLVISVARNNDAHDAWHTVTIANRSELSVSYRDFALGWFIMTPLGRLHLNWAYSPEEETSVQTIAPQATETFRIDDEDWSLPIPADRAASAYLRLYFHLPSRGRGVWLPVRMTAWKDGGMRERLLRRLYVPRRPSDFDGLP
jgi:hypothetical protein